MQTLEVKEPLMLQEPVVLISPGEYAFLLSFVERAKEKLADLEKLPDYPDRAAFIRVLRWLLICEADGWTVESVGQIGGE